MASDTVATPCRINSGTAERAFELGHVDSITLHDRADPCGNARPGIPTFVEFVEATADRHDVDVATCQFCGARIFGDDDDDGEELTASAIAIVDALEEHGEMTTDEMAERAGLATSTVYNYLADLQANGRIESRPDPDHSQRQRYSLAHQDPHDRGDGQRDADSSESEADPRGESATATGTGDDRDGDGDDDDADDGTDSHGQVRECECGQTFDGRLEYTIHRTEAHESPQRRLDYLEPGEFEEAVEAADSVQDVADAVGWSTARVLRVLGIYGIDIVDEDVELSDINDVDFDGVGDVAGDPDLDIDDGGADQAADGGRNGRTGPTVIDLEAIPYDHDEIVDAVANAQSVHHVTREFHPALDRNDVEALLEALGFLEDLRRGGFNPDRAAIERAIQEVAG
jgi:hypothetical protein